MVYRVVSYKTILTLICLVTILTLAAYVRLHQVGINPGWYTDEATHIDIAQHLMHGRVQHMAVRDSMLLFARLPLYHHTLAAAFHHFGVDIITARTLTAIIGVLASALMFATVRGLGYGRGLALLAALLMAVYPQAVLYSRLAFSYQLLVPLVIMFIYGLAQYRHGARWGLLVAALCFSLMSITEVAAMTFLPALLIVIALRRWRDAIWALPVALLLVGVYVVSMLLTAPDAFLYDAVHTFGRVSSRTLGEQIALVFENTQILTAQDSLFILVGVCAAWLLIRGRWWWLIVCVPPLLLTARTFPLFSLSAYYLIPYVPVLLMLVIVTAHHLITSTRRRWRPLIQTGVMATLILISATWFSQTWRDVHQGYRLGIEAFLINAADGREMAAFMQPRLQPDDVIIMGPTLAWLLDARVVDFQMSAAMAGLPSQHLPADLPAQRFAFDGRFEQADYVIIDRLWDNWVQVHVPAAAAYQRHIEATGHLLFKVGDIRVYQPVMPTPPHHDEAYNNKAPLHRR